MPDVRALPRVGPVAQRLEQKLKKGFACVFAVLYTFADAMDQLGAET